MQTGAGAVLNELRPRAGSTFAVTGAGAVGLAALTATRIVGCTTIIAVDDHDSRLELAGDLGATHTINSRTGDLADELMSATRGKGVDYVVDTTARPGVLTAAAGALAIRGTLALVGAAAPGTTVPFEIGQSLVKGWTFTTIVQGSAVPQVFIPRLVELYEQGPFPIRHYPLDDINDAFTASESGAVGKPVVLH